MHPKYNTAGVLGCTYSSQFYEVRLQGRSLVQRESIAEIYTMLNAEFALTEEHINNYGSQGFVQLQQVMNVGRLEALESKLSALVRDLNPSLAPLEERSTYKRAFIQTTNIWQHSETLRQLVMHPGLAGLAARLMGCETVRLYHDQALFKEAGGGHTPWHRDQVYWPLDTDKTCTIWIPLVAVPKEMGPLSFVAGSHQWEAGRELVISDASDDFFEKLVKTNSAQELRKPFALGDVSFHSGWTLHRAGPNYTWNERAVMTIIYMDGAARICAQPTPTQLIDRDAFLPGCEPGEPAVSELTPQLWPPPNQ